MVTNLAHPQQPGKERERERSVFPWDFVLLGHKALTFEI
jgi:hypothetical protein